MCVITRLREGRRGLKNKNKTGGRVLATVQKQSLSCAIRPKVRGYYFYFIFFLSTHFPKQKPEVLCETPSEETPTPAASVGITVFHCFGSFFFQTQKSFSLNHQVFSDSITVLKKKMVSLKVPLFAIM